MATKTFKRLGKLITPKNYNLRLVPDLSNFTFVGEEKVSIELQKDSKTITFHAADLEITKVILQQGKIKQEGKVRYAAEDETVTFSFKNYVKKGKASIFLEFKGTLNDKMRGFYRSSYKNGDKDEFMAVTQFEATDARRAFPGIDEPSAKATFEVTLVVPEDTVAISNTLPVSKKVENGKKEVTFAKTPLMSTYLLAFIIGKFEYLQAKTQEGKDVRVYVTPGKKHQAKFALETTSKILSFYAKYFGISYPLDSMQLIAIPDFAAGAMENWGAVTYRETAVLVDPKETSTANKQYIAMVIAHELAHQWFGNLVTMDWWTQLWLNESFATYIEYVAVDKIFPEWSIWTQFLFMVQSQAMQLDGLKNTHPIEVPVEHPAEISEIFDPISYEKGASVLHMLATYLGSEVFRKGLQKYLKAHKYSNATTLDFWKALEEVSGKPVKKVMQNWTAKAGYPLLKTEEQEKTVKVSQERFFSSPLERGTEHTTWSVPLKLLFEDGETDQLLLNKKVMIIRKPLGWYKLNSGEASYARVLYATESLSRLQQPITLMGLTEADRFGIIRDTFAAVKGGYSSTDTALSLVRAYRQDFSYIVWVEILTQLGDLGNLLALTELEQPFKDFKYDLLEEIVREVGFEKKSKEHHMHTLLRSNVLLAAGKAGNHEVIKKVNDLFIKGDIASIPPDLRTVVYTVAAYNGGTEVYQKLRDMYDKAELQEEKDRIVRGLCAISAQDLLKETMEFGFSSKMRAQDTFRVVAFVWANPNGREIAWEFVQKRWDQIVKSYHGGHLLTRFINPAENFTTNEKAKEVEQFFKRNSVAGIERTVAQVVEQIKAQAAWYKRDHKAIYKFLTSNNS